MPIIKKIVLAVFLMLPAVAVCQTTTQEEPFVTHESKYLSAKAKEARHEAMQQGLEAANREDWAGAVELFEKASGIDPNFTLKSIYISPPVYFNLALAYDRLGGRDLPALAYYRIYLALVPDDPNAQAIQQRLAELQTSIKANTRKLLTVAEQSAAEFPAESTARSRAFSEVVVAKAFIGDVSSALAIAYRPENKYLLKNDLSSIAEAQAKSGDFQGAETTARKIQETGSTKLDAFHANKTYVGTLRQIAELKAAVGDVEGALAIVDQMDRLLREHDDQDFQPRRERVWAYAAIVDELIKEEKFNKAREVMPLIVQIADTIRRPSVKFEGYVINVENLIALGEIQEAWKSAESIIIQKSWKLERSIKGVTESRNKAYSHLTMGLLRLGETEQARRALKEISPDFYRRKYLKSSIKSIEYLKQALVEAKNDQERDEAKLQLILGGVRPLGPLYFKYTNEGLQLMKQQTPEHYEADKWLDLGGTARYRKVSKDFNMFLRELQKNKSDEIVNSAIYGINGMIEQMREYNRLDTEFRLRRQLMKRQ